ncbi:MAG: 3-deoxy-D-manno-octulosonic acid transferase [Deltaproteobacteria bacterium]|jgi:3-deoxy-D-manno-octulosonic-acid transferase|nr:3-deoxy-D-manno-octulosonic acid transferase [Deltaproteobacteria bacterium]
MNAVYALLWKAARPFLRRHKRLADGFAERLVPPGWPFTPEMQARPSFGLKSACRIWIQAASGGEAYVCAELLKQLAQGGNPHVLCTACTLQGLEVLRKTQEELNGKNITITVNYLPLDDPGLMDRAVEQAFGPAGVASGNRVMVLLETEIWPGLLAACRRAGVKTLFINARMTGKSLRAYKLLAPLLRMAAPQGALATSREDLQRFCRVFDGPAGAEPGWCRGVMPNIKFDRVYNDAQRGAGCPDMRGNGLPGLIALGSVREEEERLLLRIIPQLMRFPLVIAPRHLHRVAAWAEALRQRGLDFVRRSASADLEELPRKPGRIVLWDVFGELDRVYAMADAAFVGGSLAPLGGQNFLEPLACGVSPCIGPYWSNFYWAGRELFDLGLVTRVRNESELGRALLRTAENPRPAPEIKLAFRQYLSPHLGGAKQAAELIFKEYTAGRQGGNNRYT